VQNISSIRVDSKIDTRQQVCKNARGDDIITGSNVIITDGQYKG